MPNASTTSERLLRKCLCTLYVSCNVRCTQDPAPTASRSTMPLSPNATGRRPRNSLTVESIIDAAESVAIEGFDGLTIRAVASELGASPMALYRYFATKDELVDALLDRVLGRFEEPAATDDWFADLHTFARNHYAMLASQPWAITPLVSHPNPG